MRSLEKYISECSVNEAKVDRKFVDSLATTDKEPNESARKDYVRIEAYDRFWDNVAKPVYVRIDDLDGYTDRESMMAICYNLAKNLNTKATQAEVCVWAKDVTDDSKMTWRCLCLATLAKAGRIWDAKEFPNYPFK